MTKNVGAKENPRLPTLLISAINRGDIEAVKIIIKARGAYVNTQSKDGDTPLYIAALKGNEEMCKLLIEAGADVNVPNKDGNTPIHLAAYMDNTNIAKLLIEKGANVNLQNNSGETAQNIAGSKGNIKIIRAIGNMRSKSQSQSTMSLLASMKNALTKPVSSMSNGVNIKLDSRHQKITRLTH